MRTATLLKREPYGASVFVGCYCGPEYGIGFRLHRFLFQITNREVYLLCDQEERASMWRRYQWYRSLRLGGWLIVVAIAHPWPVQHSKNA